MILVVEMSIPIKPNTNHNKPNQKKGNITHILISRIEQTLSNKDSTVKKKMKKNTRFTYYELLKGSFFIDQRHSFPKPNERNKLHYIMCVVEKFIPC